MTVRVATHEDLPSLKALLEDTGLAIKELRYDNFTHPVLVAEVEGKVVGMLSALLGHPYCYITEIAVAPEWQNRGVATQLGLTFEDHIRLMGYTAWATCTRVGGDGEACIARWPGVKQTGLASTWIKTL